VSSTASTRDPETGQDGSFRRQVSQFRRWVSADDGSEFRPQAGRYHLYVARACPWAHRTIIVRRLMGLEDAIGISFVDPIRDERGWAFTGDGYVDQAGGMRYLSEAYLATDPEYAARVTVPVLWDKQTGEIVSNESADIVRMLHTAFAPVAEHPVELRPASLSGEIDALNERIYDNVNNAVYKAGFSRNQAIYEREVAVLFAMLDELDERLADRRFLLGPVPLETDWRLFPTLVRFDAVYQIHFKCSLHKLIEYEHLWPYARDLYQWPSVAETVDFDEIRRHYYLTHPMINPSGLVAVCAAQGFDLPPGRGSLG